MRIATWNVNGIRARAAQLGEWIARDRPDVVCLQEIKAEPAQVPEACRFADYHACFHGQRGYSGVALLVRRDALSAEPAFLHPAFDVEARIVHASVGDVVIASVYVPNGGRDYDAKLAFLDRLAAWMRELNAQGRSLVVCGDINVTRADIDVHPKERKAGVIGQRPEERALFASLLGEHSVDVGRALDPANEGLFTWWAPWRNLRQRNIGWRIDYILASRALAGRARDCRVLADVGTSDHAPVVVTLA